MKIRKAKAKIGKRASGIAAAAVARNSAGAMRDRRERRAKDARRDETRDRGEW